MRDRECMRECVLGGEMKPCIMLMGRNMYVSLNKGYFDSMCEKLLSCRMNFSIPIEHLWHNFSKNRTGLKALQIYFYSFIAGFCSMGGQLFLQPTLLFLCYSGNPYDSKVFWANLSLIGETSELNSTFWEIK